jgi:hypothetical protein
MRRSGRYDCYIEAAFEGGPRPGIIGDDPDAAASVPSALGEHLQRGDIGRGEWSGEGDLENPASTWHYPEARFRADPPGLFPSPLRFELGHTPKEIWPTGHWNG